MNGDTLVAVPDGGDRYVCVVVVNQELVDGRDTVQALGVSIGRF